MSDELNNELPYEKPIVQNALSPEQMAFDAKCFNALDNSDAGKDLMEELRKILTGPCWQPGATSEHGYFNEGIHHLIRHLDVCIKRHKSGVDA